MTAPIGRERPELTVDVVISASVPLAMTDSLPDGGSRTWAPISTTLICGTDDAVLVDPPLTRAQAAIVGDRIAATRKRLTHIFITHAHGDHWFTAALIADRFPAAVVVASETAIEGMHQTVNNRATFWDAILPDQIPDTSVTAQPVNDGRLLLEGHELNIVDVGHSDTDGTSVLHVPSLDLVIAGDVLYDGVHQFLVESHDEGRARWRRAIDIVERLQPNRVVAGHGRADSNDDARRIIAQTRRYLDDTDEVLSVEATPNGFFEEMKRRHPQHLNASTLWGSALALYA